MCRLIAYLGSEVLLEDVLVKPVNSIIMQSIHARETTIPTNGDGFGLGWYTPEINLKPAVFVSVFPAWNDENLLNLTAKIKSPCFFSHVRAASVGGINNYNCHPFTYGQWMLMHNGEINDFISVKRHLRHLLDDDIYHWIRGETDSEHIFALFMQLAKGKDLNQLSVVADVLQETLYEVNKLVKEFGKRGPSFFNICLTDGQRLVASRYCSNKRTPPESLHYLAGNFFTAQGQPYHHEKMGDAHECVMITSEKLTDLSEQWHEVPANHLLLVDQERRIQMRRFC